MTFDPAAFRRQFDEACNIAEGIRTPIEVRARPRVQANREILVGKCPKCSNVAAIDKEGKHLCKRCGTWLHYRRDDGRPNRRGR